MTRLCARPGCNDHASSTLAYDYAQRTVWLDDVAHEGHPSTYDLCKRHANSLCVPMGWQLRDRRNLVPNLAADAKAS
jgi:hypothetical protein